MKDELMRIDNIFPTKTFQSVPEKLHPIFKMERKILVLSKKSGRGIRVYKQFLEDLSNYSAKMSNDYCKSCIDMLLKRNLIFLGRNASNVKSGIIGTFIVKNQSLAGVVLDLVEMGVDTDTGLTSNIDSCYYASYFEFIRAAVITHEKEIIKDEKVHKFACQYLMLLLMRLVGSGVNLTDKQKLFLNSIIVYFYYRFMLMENHHKAREMVLKDLNPDMKKEVDFHMPKLSKYETMRDVFKAMLDYGVVRESPSVLTMKALNRFKTFIFYAFTSSLDYVIALAIVSRYPADFLNNAMINNNMQTVLEKEMSKYYKRVKFDTTALFTR